MTPNDAGPREDTVFLLRQWASGDSAALNRLAPRVYKELRRIAGNLMKHEQPGHTLAATALVNEAYLKLVDLRDARFEDRAHFLAVASKMMRQILLDQARRRGAAKRGGPARRVDFGEVAEAVGAPERDAQLIALDAALEELALVDERRARVVEMRYFGGLTVEESAAVLGISAETVMRDWRVARAWLSARINA